MRFGLGVDVGWARGLVARADDRLVARIDGPFVAALLAVDLVP
jgi:hypothetical protein